MRARAGAWLRCVIPFVALSACGRQELNGPRSGVQDAAPPADGTRQDAAIDVEMPRQQCAATDIAAGYNHTCALAGKGSVWCWGANESGQLGDGTNTERHLPTLVAGLPPVVEITAGIAHTCARTEDGYVYCWGTNTTGELGDGTFEEKHVPTLVKALGANAAKIGAGDAFTCAYARDGNLWCWGANFNWQLGDGTSLQNQPMPLLLTSKPSPIDDIAIGGEHSCLLSRGTVWCWGANGGGELGLSSPDKEWRPTYVPLPRPVNAVSAGGRHTCAILDDGTLWCWGENGVGQIGSGGPKDGNSTPFMLTGFKGSVATVSAGGLHTCSLEGSGAAWCWGQNSSGEVGDGTIVEASRPRPVVSPPAAMSKVVTGKGAFQVRSHSCALDDKGYVWCWGSNNHGQIGDGAVSDRSAPTAVKPCDGS